MSFNCSRKKNSRWRVLILELVVDFLLDRGHILFTLQKQEEFFESRFDRKGFQEILCILFFESESKSHDICNDTRVGSVQECELHLLIEERVGLGEILDMLDDGACESVDFQGLLGCGVVSVLGVDHKVRMLGEELPDLEAFQPLNQYLDRPIWEFDPLQDFYDNSGIEQVCFSRTVFGGVSTGEEQPQVMLLPQEDFFHCGDRLRMPDHEGSHQSRIKHRPRMGDGEQGLREDLIGENQGVFHTPSMVPIRKKSRFEVDNQPCRRREFKNLCFHGVF